jgi:hypothetical protein
VTKIITKPIDTQLVESGSGSVTSKVMDKIRVMRHEEPPRSSIADVIKSKLASYVEKETTKARQEEEKQTAALRRTVDNVAETVRVCVEMQVFIETKRVEILNARHQAQRISDQIAIEQELFPQQLRVQATALAAAQERAEADLIAATTGRSNAAQNAQNQEEVDRKFSARRIQRTDEKEEAEHRLAMAELAARERMFASSHPMASRPGQGGDGDRREAMNVAEDVADGHVVTDAAHPYHGYAGVLWIGCLRRGIDRDQALQEVAAKVLDRIERHPLTERDARAYHQRYLDALQEYDADQAAAATRETEEERVRAQEREREARRFESRTQKDADLKKAAMERDAALARERVARTFMAGSYNPKDDSDVVA